jgi:carboxylesterase
MAPVSDVLPGAEPWSAPGGPHGALVVHGFTGSPQSMRGLAEAFAAAGFAVELPRLPGHGTTVAEMATTGWSDWSAAVEEAYTQLSQQVDRVVVAGLSMGGTLSLWLASRHPELAGAVLVNAAVGMGDDAMRQGLQDLIDQGVEMISGVGNDVADPDVTELAYSEVPVRALLSLGEAMADLDLAAVRCPVLLMNSPQDHVVPATAAETIASSVSGPLERLVLEKSFHVATLDYDKDIIESAAVEFARKVCST